MRKLKLVLIIIFILLVAVLVLRDQLIKFAITKVATALTGAPVKIDKFSLCLLKQDVTIEGLRVYNPPGFSGGLLIDIAKIKVDLDALALLKGKLHLQLVELNLKEIGLEKNKEGKLNIDSLKVVEQKAPGENKDTKQPDMQIDLLNLEMGKMVFKDYSLGQEPSVKVFEINLKKSYKDITSPQQLALLILSEPMKQAGIKGAAIYGAALLTGVGFVPVVAVAALTGKDSVQQNIELAFDKLFDLSLQVLNRAGRVTKHDKAKGTISADLKGAGVALELKKISDKTTQITVSARKYMLPKPEVANGVLYQIGQELNKK